MCPSAAGGTPQRAVRPQHRVVDVLAGAPRWQKLTPAQARSAPYSGVACIRLHIAHPGPTAVFFMGTGWFLTPDTVVTAAHVTDISEAWARVPLAAGWHLEIIPAFAAAQRPLGTFWTTSLIRHPRWNGEHTTDFDIAVVKVAPASAGMPMASANCLTPQADAIAAGLLPHVQVAGYPYAVDSGGTPVVASGSVRIVEGNLCFYDADTEDGQSGAPVMSAGPGTPAVVAIHSAGRGNGSTGAAHALNAGLRLRRDLVDWLKTQ
jgi:V8-like Glu-specific endopeptidase